MPLLLVACQSCVCCIRLSERFPLTLNNYGSSITWIPIIMTRPEPETDSSSSFVGPHDLWIPFSPVQFDSFRLHWKGSEVGKESCFIFSNSSRPISPCLAFVVPLIRLIDTTDLAAIIISINGVLGVLLKSQTQRETRGSGISHRNWEACHSLNRGVVMLLLLATK